MIDKNLVAALARAQGATLRENAAETIATSLTATVERIVKAGNAAPFEAEPAGYVVALTKGKRS